MIEQIATAFAHGIATGTHDVVTVGTGLEIQTDHWTIVLSENEGATFVALDDGSDADSEHLAAIADAFSGADLDALRSADAALAGALTARLTGSPDRLAVLLARRIAADPA